MYKKFILYALVLTVVLAGCETTHGVGKDMENAGKSIQKTVDKNR